MNNGTSTGYFSIERGTRQGDPLSQYLFILTLEILFIKVRNDSSIKGFWIKQIEIELSAYADDTTFFCEGCTVTLENSKPYEEVLRILIINN